MGHFALPLFGVIQLIWLNQKAVPKRDHAEFEGFIFLGIFLIICLNVLHILTYPINLESRMTNKIVSLTITLSITKTKLTKEQLY